MNIRTLIPLAAFAALATATGAAAAQGGRLFTVAMTGAAQQPGQGDPDGTGTAEIRVNAGRRQVCYTLAVRDIGTATAAHLHRGGPAVAGPPVVPLTAPATGRSHGCATVPRALAQEIIRTPGAFYVNIHTAAFPAGAIRGQLGR
jgi:hypothetical protein